MKLLPLLLLLPFAIAQVPDLSEQTIIIYNTNDVDSYDIAAYYANARGISLERLCPVQLPPGQFATAQQFMGARKHIIENCICDAIADSGAVVPQPCDSTNLDAIADVSPITHIAIMKGVPPRLTGTGWPTDNEEPPLDYYLSVSLYRYNHIFNEGERGYPFGIGNNSIYFGYYTDEIDNQPAASEYAYTRPIDPALDKQVAYGRVEAMDKQRTMELIERTIESEHTGLSGNFLAGLFPQWNENITYDFFRDLTSGFSDECNDYLTTGAQWPYESCRAGASRNGQLPGETKDTLPRGINVTVFLNRNYNGNGQAGFDNFDTLTNWHKSDYDCVELCQDFTEPNKQQACRDRSTDYFRELNTDCVGASPGLIGYQLRSYPVQYYGFWPPDWTQRSAGPSEKSPPYVIETGGYQNEKFTDTKFLRFGSRTRVVDPLCTLANGTVEPCPEKVGVDLSRVRYFSGANNINGTRTYTMRFYFRNEASPGKRIYIRPRIRFVGNTSDTYLPSKYIDLGVARQEWTKWEHNFTVGQANASYERINIDVYTTIPWAPSGFVDFDAFEFIDLSTGKDIWHTAKSSFSAPYVGYTTYGDYASNAIDRLGGIAWWGSSSHHLTGGYAFASTDNFQAAFFSGRSLGEGIARTGTTAMSGIVYGDPLYSPSGVKIYLNDGLMGLHDEIIRDRFTFNKWSDDKLYINAFHGRLSSAWQLDVCNHTEVTECYTWYTVESGNSAVFDYLVIDNLAQLVQDTNHTQQLIVRLHVWNEYDEGIYDYAYMNYIAYPDACSDNDHDGFLAGTGCGLLDCDDNDPDVHPLKLEDCDLKDDNCDGLVDNDCYCKVDLNDDYKVDNADYTIMQQQRDVDCFDPDQPCCVPKENCSGDFNFDGVVDNLDWQIYYAEEEVCNSQEPCQGNLDNDTDVDMDDLMLLESQIGQQCPCTADIDIDGDVDMDDRQLLVSEMNRVTCWTCNNDGSCDVFENVVSCPQDCHCEMDINHDGMVSIFDYIFIRNLFAQNITNCTIFTPCMGDINNDMIVDQIDMDLTRSDIGRTDCPICDFDHMCDDWENESTCEDCINCNQNAICEPNENSSTCPYDCQCKGDLNVDGQVNSDDWTILFAQINATACQIKGCKGDIDDDGDVDTQDLDALEIGRKDCPVCINNNICDPWENEVCVDCIGYCDFYYCGNHHDADLNRDGTVGLIELIQYIALYKDDEKTILQVRDAVNEWKG